MTYNLKWFEIYEIAKRSALSHLYDMEKHGPWTDNARSLQWMQRWKEIVAEHKAYDEKLLAKFGR